jgi:hypothetical protein
MRRLFEHLKKLWSHEEDIHMRKVAHRYAERALMDGHVIQKTGEVISKESV